MELITDTIRWMYLYNFILGINKDKSSQDEVYKPINWVLGTHCVYSYFNGIKSYSGLSFTIFTIGSKYLGH